MLRIGAAWVKEKEHNALKNRDVACGTATGKIPDQKGNKWNPNNDCISCSSTHHNTAISYYAYAMPHLEVQWGMNTRI